MSSRPVSPNPSSVPSDGRLVLLDASKVPDKALDNLLANGSLSLWLRLGRRADEGADPMKLSALKAALDIGALNDEEYAAALERLMPEDPFQSSAEKLALLQAAVEGGALTEDQFKDAVARLHLAQELKVGDRVEVRDTTIQDWRVGTVTKISAHSGRLEIYVQPDTYSAPHVWEYIRKHADNRDEMQRLQAEVDRLKAERDGLLARVDRLLRENRGDAEGDSRILKTPVAPKQAKYELYGFAFDIKSTVMIKIKALNFGTRTKRPSRVSVYASTDGVEKLRNDPSRWRIVSEPVIVQQTEEDTVCVPLTDPITISPSDEGVTALLVHSPDDMQAVVYSGSTAPPGTCVVTEDGCLQIMTGDAAQQDRAICNTFRGFAFSGSVEYTVVADAEASAAGKAGDDNAPSLTPKLSKKTSQS
ncbi:hypothetical protein DIPPA_03202 [Diplonema papillatum]|nr:hypothetical protein DIPPA_03202 [Diplonema papillatum]